MTMKLSVLCDNNTLIDQYFLGEPAVSYYLEIDGARILFDTGYSDVFLKNAETLGIDLQSLTHIVLSHSHNDHTNGLPLLRQRFNVSAVPLIAHPLCFYPRWYEETYIGPPYTADIGAHFHYQPAHEPLWLTEHCVFLGEIPVTHDFEPRRPIGEMELNGTRQPDLMLDDSALACRTDKGLFIVTGCSHSGICNIISYAQQVCGEERIAGVVGGFHLLQDTPQVDATIEFFKSLGPACRLYPCHCVSLHNKAKMLRHLDFPEIGSGTVIEA